MRIGSMFSGAGMLDVAALELFPESTLAWHCEVDPAASKVLAHHWPDVPNLGDVTGIDWAGLEAVDVITGGFPCQDVSAAGRMDGLADGNRSGLWSHMCTAIEVLRPQFVLIENVRGLLSAPAIRHLESEADALGDNETDPVLRALGAVLGSLAVIGFDADWAMLRASDIGACHHRARIFISAYPAEAAGAGPQGPRKSPDPGPPASGGQRHLARCDSEAVVVLPTPSVADGTGGHANRSGARSGELLLAGLARAAGEGSLLPTPRSSDGAKGGPNMRGSSGDRMLPSAVVHWGDYERAIRRQEVWTRPAPQPTEPNAQGRLRLSPAFSEWMMGWPSGWVTDPVVGLSRIDQLRVIGNGVVVPQAVAAFRHLLALRGAAS